MNPTVAMSPAERWARSKASGQRAQDERETGGHPPPAGLRAIGMSPPLPVAGTHTSVWRMHAMGTKRP